MITLVVLYHSHFVRNCFLSFLQCEWVIKSPRQNSSKTYLSEIFPFPLISDSVSTLTILESGLSPYFTANRAVSFYLNKSEYRISSSSFGEQILEEKREINICFKYLIRNIFCKKVEIFLRDRQPQLRLPLSLSLFTFYIDKVLKLSSKVKFPSEFILSEGVGAVFLNVWIWFLLLV